MPSIANQDYKIYGLLKDSPLRGVTARFCGEFIAALIRSWNSAHLSAQMLDGYVFNSIGDTLCKIVGGPFVFDTENESIMRVDYSHYNNPAYYDALWAIQKTIYNFDESIVENGMEFTIIEGKLMEQSAGYSFVNEDGYTILATAADGKLASISLGEREDLDEPVIRLETLLPLVGELPLGTTEIW